MFNEKFKDTLAHEGAVALVTCDGKEAHVANTWNSYVNILGDNKLLIPAAGMRSLEQDTANHSDLKITFGSKEVEGTQGMGAGLYLRGKNQHPFHSDLKITFGSKEVEGTQGMGAGFYLVGKGEFKENGKEYDLMKAKFPWLRKVLIVTVDQVKQTI